MNITIHATNVYIGDGTKAGASRDPEPVGNDEAASEEEEVPLWDGGPSYLPRTSGVPSSPTAADLAEDRKREEERLARIERGMTAWTDLVRTWSVNFGVEGAKQPDRYAAFQAASTAHHREIAAYIENRGGLVNATLESLLLGRYCDAEEANLLAKRIALNMVQVSSRMGVTLEPYLELSIYQIPAIEAPDIDERTFPRQEPGESQEDFEARCKAFSDDVTRLIEEARSSFTERLKAAPIRGPMLKDHVDFQRSQSDLTSHLDSSAWYT